MRFSVLKAGRSTRAARARIGDMDRMFMDLLSRPGDRWESHDVEHDVFPENVTDFDGFVITGGRASAYDKDGWVEKLLETVQEAHVHHVPLLGICLGHQVVAKALGGEVGVNPLGWDIGLTQMTLTPEGARLDGLNQAPRPLSVLQTHQDIVTGLPPEAVHLAFSPKTRYEMFHLGPTVFCMQGHPEMDNEEVREIISLRREDLPPAVVNSGLESLAEEPHRQFLRSFLQDFLHDGGLAEADQAKDSADQAKNAAGKAKDAAGMANNVGPAKSAD